MKPQQVHLSIPPPSFARPISPCCFTAPESHFSNNDTPPIPSYTSGLTREYSWNASTFVGGPTTATWRIQPGAYIAFALDTEAIAERFPIGSEAYESVQLFPVNRYIGLVSASYSYNEEDTSDGSKGRSVEELVVHYVAGSVPRLPGLESLWMPISPFSDFENASLNTTTLFPLKDRYQWTTFGARLRIEHLHESSLQFPLVEDDFVRFEEQAAIDYPSMAELQASELGAEDSFVVDLLKVPSFSLPVQVWRDVREATCRDDPIEFVAEVSALERYVL
ncbi:hypothetical protein PHLCEN_2v13289 [Hermanssonia centrifuga]|uniref:Uncharacterized protein n=1 Tax=Hermanssonia centrifuga TaxID=98765 RepID=A0A2R6NF17_9APHY|nr:hypothetical protein PHLCEN_2v13289 [Hermanssonia centrifuga]